MGGSPVPPSSPERPIADLDRDLIGERYRSLECLHEAEGRLVVLAEDTWRPGIRRILKIGAGTLLKDQHSRRLRNEFRVLREFAHPSIPRALDFGIDPRIPRTWLALQRVDGQVPGREGPLDAEAVRDIARGVLRALDTVHSRDRFHLDIKPDNLLWDAGRRHVTLIDFDLSAGLDCGIGRGTLPYAAPEVIRSGERFGPRADLFSLGVTLFELLEGSVPRFDAIPSDGLVPTGDAIPAGLAELVNRLTRASAFERPPTARAAMAVLDDGAERTAFETPEGIRARLAHPPFVGRRVELDRLATLSRAPRDRTERPPIFWLRAPAGCGSSRLLRQARSQWLEAGVRVARVSPRPDRRLAVAPLLDLAARLSPGYGAARSDDAALDEEALSTERRQELVRWLLLAARRRRLVVVFEDLHRFDAASRRFVLDLLDILKQDAESGAGHPHLAVVVASDPALRSGDDLDVWLESGIEAASVEAIDLAPFDPELAEEYLVRLTAPEKMPGPIRTAILSRSGGSPAFIRELVLEGRVQNGGDGHLLGGLSERVCDHELVPLAVRSSVIARCARIGATGNELLHLLARCPDGLARAEVHAVMGEEGVVAGDALERAALVTGERRRWRLPSELFRAALLSQESAKADPDASDRLAEALAQLGSPRYEEIWHRLGGVEGRAALDDALETLCRLARERRRREQRLLLGRLAGLQELSPYVARHARVELARLDLFAGRVHEAADRLRWTSPADFPAIRLRARIDRAAGDRSAARRRLLALRAQREWHTPREEAELAIDLCEVAFELGEFEAAEKELLLAAADIAHPAVEALTGTGELSHQDLRFPWPGEDALVLARWLRWWGRRERFSGRTDRAELSLRAALRLFSRLPDQGDRAATMNDIGVLRLVQARTAGGVQYLQRALRQRQDGGDLRGLAETESNLGVALRRSSRFGEAVRCFGRARGLRERIGDRPGEMEALVNLANVHLQRRELKVARTHYETALSDIQAGEVGGERQAVILNNLGIVASLEARFEEALARFTFAESLAQESGDAALLPALALQRGEIELAVGRLDRAREELERCREGLTRMRLEEVAMRGDLLEVRVMMAADVDANEVDQALLQARSRWPQALGEDGEVTLVEAEAAAYRDRPDRALALLERRDSWNDGPAADQASAADRGDPVEVGLRRVILSAEMALLAGDAHTGDLLAALGEAERVARKADMPLLVFSAVRMRARVRRTQGRHSEALSAYETALEAVEPVLEAFLDEELLDCFLQTDMMRGLDAEVGGFVSGLPDEAPQHLAPQARRWSDELRRQLFSGLRRMGGHGADTLRRDRVLRPVLELARTLNSTDSEQAILTGLVETVVDFHNAERAFLLTLDARGSYRVAVACSRDRVPVENPDREISRNIVRRVLETGRSLRSDDAAEDDELRTVSVIELQVRSVMCAPLRHGDETLGLIYVDNRSRSEVFRDGDVELLDVFATAAASTLVNARLARSFARNEKMRVLGRIAEDVAHEFNNLLTPILGRAQGLLEQLEDGVSLANHGRRDLEVISQAALDASAVVRRFQDYARVRRDAQRETLALRAVLADVREFTRSNIEKVARRTGKTVDFELVVEGEPMITGEPVALREIFTNLVLNAADAVAEGPRETGEIRIQAERRGELVRVRLTDNGVGMTESVREQLFDPYFSTKEEEGSGLGMSIILSHVQRHGGRIDVDSTEGEGTIIKVWLPVAEAEREERTPESAGGAVVDQPISGPGGRAPRRLLIVDDDHGVRALMVDVLRREGYQVDDTSDGRRAIEMMAERPYEVVFSDIGMSPLDGWEVAREIKKIEPRTVIVMVSGWSSAIDERTLSEKNADLILGKPFAVRGLADSAREAFARRDAAKASPTVAE